MNITFPLILDGAMGTRLFAKGLPVGACPEQWILEHKEAAFDVLRSYVDAGSQIIYAPTFGANSACLEKNGLFNKVEEYNSKLVEIAKEAADGRAMVAGDISSTGGMLYPMGDMSFQDLYDIYFEQAQALEKAGVDLFVIETMTAVPEARAALLAVKAASSKPVFVSFSCDATGRTMMGTDVLAALEIMQGMGADAFGLNCSVGPAEIAAQIRRIYPYACVPLIAKPNAGLPENVDGKVVYSVSAVEFAKAVDQLAEAGAAAFGACCGSDEAFIAQIKKALEGKTAGEPSPQYDDMLPCATEKDAFLLDPAAEINTVFACEEGMEEDFAELEDGELFGIEINSIEDAALFSDVQYAVRNPLCIICNDEAVLEEALKAYQGRALYDGELSDEELLPLAEKYGLII